MHARISQKLSYSSHIMPATVLCLIASFQRPKTTYTHTHRNTRLVQHPTPKCASCVCVYTVFLYILWEKCIIKLFVWRIIHYTKTHACSHSHIFAYFMRHVRAFVNTQYINVDIYKWDALFQKQYFSKGGWGATYVHICICHPQNTPKNALWNGVLCIYFLKRGFTWTYSRAGIIYMSGRWNLFI